MPATRRRKRDVIRPLHGDDSLNFGVVKDKARTRVGFFLVPSFTMLSLVSAVEPLRAANRMSARPLYSWHLVSRDGAAVEASNALSLTPQGAMHDAHGLDCVIVAGPFDPAPYHDQAVFDWLRRLVRDGAALGALETGTFVLARAGVLRGYRCTTHWENLPKLSAEFPGLDVSKELFELDRNRFTCAGGTAALDMMLNLIERQQGRDLAAAVAEGFVHDHIRQAHEPQRMSLQARTGVRNDRLLGCIALMESNLEQPLLPAHLAVSVGVSKRQLERLFRAHLDTTPARYYMGLRLNQGRRLIERTALPITEVALACGFSSLGHFSYRYRAHFGVSPREDRGSARVSHWRIAAAVSRDWK